MYIIYIYIYIYIYIIYIYVCIYICVNIYIYIYTCNRENNVPSRLSPQWLCGNSYTWAHDEQLHTAGTNEPKSIQQATQGA